MMKFKQRVLATLCVVMIGIPYLWIRYRSSSSRKYPVVENREENLLHALLLDSAFDLNNLDHRHENTKVLRTLRQSNSLENDKRSKTTKVDQEFTSTVPKTTERLVIDNPWEVWKGMVTETRVSSNGTLGLLQVKAILKALRTAAIVDVGVGYRGSQLKASMFLEGNQRTVFKPKRYDRNFVIKGKPFDGYDRHNGEIAAFHLDRVLGFYRAPLVSGRLVNLKTEVLPVIHDALKKTFFTQGNNTCFYGVCYYCKRAEPACADGDVIESSITIWLPQQWSLKSWRHPWQRTYSSKRKAKWETDPTYCVSVMKMVPYNQGPRLTSIIDTAVFDFLIGNADRHHYETFAKLGNNGFLLHLDNGKSFGNPNVDEISILAPLYQCCRILRSTWNTLNSLNNRKDKPLSETLKDSLNFDPLSPILTQNHLDALDRRLGKIVEHVNKCISKNGEDIVLVEG